MEEKLELNSKDTKEYKIILYYIYTNIENPDEYREVQFNFCQSHGLLGRIILGSEGINGTLAGKTEDIDSYIEFMQADPRFKDIVFKSDYVDYIPFPKLRVRSREEIVTLQADVEIDARVDSAKYITPEELNKLLSENDDLLLFDTRNNYESKIGHFKDALLADIENFREFPDFVKKLPKEYKNKKIVTYCTGGIRCEKASSYLIKNGFNDVYQLEGGIVTYAKQFDKGFLGKCYVFDRRISVAFKEDFEKLANCYKCGIAESEYINCSNKACNKMLIICSGCNSSLGNYCKDNCLENTSANAKTNQED